MKIHAIISFLCLASVALGTSCKDDETHFLQRSHDALSFPYLNSTKELLVLTNGSWKITPDDTWISCSPGEGNGAPKEQAVNITVAQNDGAERTGSITLSDGLKELVIRVTQEDGFFTVGSPEIAPSFDLYEELVDKRVTIPYQKSKPGYKADVTATLEGAGAEGIAIESLSGYEMEAGDGAIPLALSGTPTKKARSRSNCTWRSRPSRPLRPHRREPRQTGRRSNRHDVQTAAPPGSPRLGRLREGYRHELQQRHAPLVQLRPRAGRGGRQPAQLHLEDGRLAHRQQHVLRAQPFRLRQPATQHDLLVLDRRPRAGSQ
ncbi:MAG: BACON domain-containing protein [Alistipes shahii]